MLLGSPPDMVHSVQPRRPARPHILRHTYLSCQSKNIINDLPENYKWNFYMFWFGDKNSGFPLFKKHLPDFFIHNYRQIDCFFCFTIVKSWCKVQFKKKEENAPKHGTGKNQPAVYQRRSDGSDHPDHDRRDHAGDGGYRGYPDGGRCGRSRCFRHFAGGPAEPAFEARVLGHGRRRYGGGEPVCRP